jgi:hypothetical protein
MQTRQLMEIIYVLSTLYYALQPMLLEVIKHAQFGNGDFYILSCLGEHTLIK